MIASQLLVAAYVVVLALLFVYGANCYLMAWYRLRSKRTTPLPTPPLREAPVVTVQLPIYNEEYVLPRLLDAVCALDWPRDRLDVQVLDDSTDATTKLAEELATNARDRGFAVRVLHRDDRAGFKAGALKAGLASARGSYVAVFDADFVPQLDFLRQTVPHLEHDASLACVQARWSHVNEDYSMLTRAQAIGIDGHFAVEQRVRSERGFLMNFNGTAGVWRRAAIEDAGGWSADTIAEDLDLSYRAQLAGWRFLYLDDVAAPAEIPTQVHAFKRQQARWAQGSIQCLRKHAGSVLRSKRLRPGAKIEALLHLSHYFVHPLMLSLSLLLLAIALARGLPFPLAGLFFGATFGPPTMYLVAQRALHPTTWRARWRRLFPLTLLGVGIAASNTRAVWLGLTRKGGEFRRTPKFRIERAGDSWRDKRYALPLDGTALAEAALALLMAVAAALALVTRRYAMLPWALLFLLAYATVFGLSVAHHIRRPAKAAKGVAPHALDAP